LELIKKKKRITKKSIIKEKQNKKAGNSTVRGRWNRTHKKIIDTLCTTGAGRELGCTWVKKDKIMRERRSQGQEVEDGVVRTLPSHKKYEQTLFFFC